MISPFFTHNILVSFIKCSFNLEDRLGLFIIPQKICIYRFEQTIPLSEISDKHFHTYLSSYSFSISVPGHTKSYKGILQFEKFAALIKTSETGSTEASALTPSCIHISFFSRLVSVSNCCKNHFYAGSKMSLHIFKR